MANCSRGSYNTLNTGYAKLVAVPDAKKKETFIRENWEGAPTAANFTGCGGAGWNAFKSPCAKCNGRDSGDSGGGSSGSRICNDCRTRANISNNCGGNACAWQPSTFYF